MPPDPAASSCCHSGEARVRQQAGARPPPHLTRAKMLQLLPQGRVTSHPDVVCSRRHRQRQRTSGSIKVASDPRVLAGSSTYLLFWEGEAAGGEVDWGYCSYYFCGKR